MNSNYSNTLTITTTTTTKTTKLTFEIFIKKLIIIK
jgi:hypothetical protein